MKQTWNPKRKFAGVRWAILAFAMLGISYDGAANDWPTDDRHYRSEGPFRAWSSIPDDPALQLGKLAVVSQVSQVLVHGGGWVVLEPDGKTVSNHAWAEKEGVARIVPGFDRWFAFLTHEGRLKVFNAGGEVDASFLPPALQGKRVVDAFFEPNWAAAIDAEGGLHVWGRQFDGITEPGNGEWRIRPSLPNGVRAVALSGSAVALSVLGDDGILRTWASNNGALALPEDLVAGGVVDFAQGIHFLARLSDKADPLMHWHFRNPESKAGKVTVDGAPVDIFTTCDGIVARMTDGSIEPVGAFRQNPRDFKPVLPLIRASSSEAVSLFRKHRGGENWDMRLLWFDGETVPVAAPAPAAEVTSVAPEVPGMPTKAPAVGGGAPDSDQPAETLPNSEAVLSRVGAYQKARSARLGELAAGYATALRNAEESARLAGQLAAVETLRKALLDADILQSHVTALAGSEEVVPVVLPPGLAGPVDPALGEMRGSFEKAFAEAERELAQALDQSLTFVQQNQVKNRKIALAKETREYREEIASAFAKAFPATANQVAAKTTTIPVPVPPAPSSAPPPANAGGKAPVAKAVRPGRLAVWSSAREDDAVRETRARGFSDLVQVQLYQDGWVVLRENGEAVGSNRDHDRAGIARLVKGWDNAFGMITNEGELLYFGPGKGRPPTRVRDVRDAFVCETHSIALHTDGTITTWGPAYTEGDLDGLKWVPAPTGLTNVEKVIGSPWLAIVITTEGMTTGWRATGPCRLGRGAMESVRDIAAKGKSIRFINKEGGMLWWRMSDSGANGYPDWKERYGPLVSLPETQDANFARTGDGSIVTDLKWIERYPDLRKALEDSKGAPEEAFSFWSGPGPHRFAWIVPR